MSFKFQTSSFRIKDFILDVLFPKRCVSCRAYNEWLCLRCKRDIRFLDQNLKKQGALDGLFYVSSFSDPIMRAMIKVWKYEFVRDLENDIAELVSVFCGKYHTLLPREVVIVPVPLHSKREIWRGFNQAEVLARAVANLIDGQVRSLLNRARYTESQAELDREEKKENIHQAFRLVDGASVIGERILLVDDCYTTGATMQECAKVLRVAGAKEVWGFVLARG